MRQLLFAISIAIFTLFGFLTPAVGEVLIKEVMTREFSIQVGRTGPNEIKEVISREASLWVNYIGDAPFEQSFSREMSFVVVSNVPPSPITDLTINLSPTGEIVTLDWSHYNQWAEGDIARFDIYYTAQGPFDTVPAQSLSITSVSAESTAKIIENLPAFTDHYYAVVPVDALGNYYTNVTYSAGYALSPEVVSREVSIFVASGRLGPEQYQPISREVSMVVTSDAPPAPISDLSINLSPTGDIATIDWKHYNQWAERDIAHFDIYYTSQGPFESVPGKGLSLTNVPAESTEIILENLPEFTDHYFAVVPVDALDNYYTKVTYSAGYVISPEVFSREVSLFIGEDVSPHNQVISREISVLKPDAKVPAPVTGLDSGFFVTTSSKKYSAVDMDWTSYNEYAENDVVQYSIYYNTKYFDSIEGMTPFKIVPAETRKFTLAGLECDAIFHFAVVAADSLGNFDSKVRSFSMKVSTCFLGEVENLSSKSGANRVVYTWEPPPEADSFLSYYNVYFKGSSTAIKIAADQTSWTGTGLLAATSYHFQIKTMDVFGNESGGASIISATYLPNPENVTIIGMGSKAFLVWDHVVPVSLVDHYAIYQSQNPFSDVSGLLPVATRKGSSIPLGTIESIMDQYFAVATVNISGAQDPSVVSVLATKEITNLSQNLENAILVLKIISGINFNERYSLDYDENGRIEISDAIIFLKSATVLADEL